MSRPRKCWYARGVIFFFQAEDGIRDFHVTGVQTCALPIFGCGMKASQEWEHLVTDQPSLGLRVARIGAEGEPVVAAIHLGLRAPDVEQRPHDAEIGRASCRERG